VKTVEISVTAEDIANGAISDCVACPIALAIGRVIPDAITVDVFTDHADFCDTVKFEPLADATLPDSAAEFINRFDNRREVQPFTFQLEVPEVES
jgi:hypothetical protein